MTDLISIVLPIYNGEKYMKESIDSVIAQTYTNWELLILDDCSTDNTAKIAAEYVEKDERIKYFKNEKNLRLPRNLNKGFSIAKGDFLSWTSDDNKYRPTALEKMHDALISTDSDFVFASCRIIDCDGKEIEYISVDKNSPKRIIGDNPVGACFMYTRKVYETIGDYNPELVLVEDYDYWQRICGNFNVTTISEILYDYRWHDGALTSTMNQEKFCRNLEKTVLKNRDLFGKLDIYQKYYYYKRLYLCHEKFNEPQNPYKSKYNHYNRLYFLLYRVPNKIKRVLSI